MRLLLLSGFLLAAGCGGGGGWQRPPDVGGVKCICPERCPCEHCKGAAVPCDCPECGESEKTSR